MEALASMPHFGRRLPIAPPHGEPGARIATHMFTLPNRNAFGRPAPAIRDVPIRGRFASPNPAGCIAQMLSPSHRMGPFGVNPPPF